MEEQALVQRCQVGEKEAFEELLAQYEGLVYNLVHRYFGNQAEASDVAQEAMIKIYRRIGDFRGRSAFKTWVYRVVTNVCLDALRKRRTAPLSLEDVGNLRAVGPGPESALEQDELRNILARLLMTLGEEHRVVLVLRDMEGLAYEEIAEILGCSLGTVKSRLSRARDALRRKFLACSQSDGWAEGRLRA